MDLNFKNRVITGFLKKHRCFAVSVFEVQDLNLRIFYGRNYKNYVGIPKIPLLFGEKCDIINKIGFSASKSVLGGTTMATSYKKLWHILVDRNMKKKDLQEKAHLTQYQMYRLNHSEDITTDTIGRICIALDVKADDIMEFIPENENEFGK